MLPCHPGNTGQYERKAGYLSYPQAGQEINTKDIVFVETEAAAAVPITGIGKNQQKAGATPHTYRSLQSIVLPDIYSKGSES